MLTDPNRAILIPGCLMALYTLGFFLFLGTRRTLAVRRRQISMRYFRTYNEGTEPDELALLTRHAINLLETPVLFYAAVAFTAIAGLATTTTVALAWGYLAARLVHAAIHLLYNNILHRFAAFLASLLALIALWVGLLLQLL